MEVIWAVGGTSMAKLYPSLMKLDFFQGRGKQGKEVIFTYLLSGEKKNTLMMLFLFNTVIWTNQDDPQQVSSFGVDMAPKAMSGKALLGKSRADMETCSFSQPHGQVWVTTECQCQKSKEENSEQERKKGNGYRQNYLLLCRSISKPLFWLKSLTLSSLLIYGTYLNNLNRRSKAHQIAMGLLFLAWCLVSPKDHSPRA